MAGGMFVSHYPGEKYHWPDTSQWKFTGDGVVKYPLTFKKLVIELPEKVLYLDQYIEPVRRDAAVKDLMVTYDPIVGPKL